MSWGEVAGPAAILLSVLAIVLTLDLRLARKIDRDDRERGPDRDTHDAP